MAQDVRLDYILQQLQAQLSKQDDRLQDHADTTARHGQMLETLTDSVEHLTKTVTTGNGQPALMVQVANLRTDVHHISSEVHGVRNSTEEMRKDIRSLRDALADKPTPSQKAEKYKAIGIVVAAGSSLLISMANMLGFHL